MQPLGCIFLLAFVVDVVGSSFSRLNPESTQANVSHFLAAPDVVVVQRPSPPMLHLMSLGLDTWGNTHVQSAPGRTTGFVSGVGTVASSPKKLPMLSLMSVSLDQRGTNEGSRSLKTAEAMALRKSTTLDTEVSNQAEESLPGFNPLDQVLPSETNLMQPHSFEGYLKFFAEPQFNSQVMALALLLLILVLLSFLLCLTCLQGSLLDSSPEPSPEEEIQQERQEFATVDLSDGSWAQVYREARGEQKEALELLFRCNIISTDEFAFSSVSQDHIQECMWIATHMLRQKPLEEWVALWQQAQQTFEDSVTACFEARGGPYSSSSTHWYPPPSLPQSNLSLGTVPLQGCGTSNSSSRLAPSVAEEDEDSPSHGAHPPDTQTSLNTLESDRWSIESELDKALAAHGEQ